MNKSIQYSVKDIEIIDKAIKERYEEIKTLISGLDNGKPIDENPFYQVLGLIFQHQKLHHLRVGIVKSVRENPINKGSDINDWL